MINVSEETKAAFLTSSTQKTIYIEFPNKNMVLSNDDIVSESFELKQTLESEPNLTFKGCNASQVKFQAAEIAEDLRGELITVSIQAGNTETIKLFTGYVESQSNLTQEDFVTNIVAYDAFYKMGGIDMSIIFDSSTSRGIYLRDDFEPLLKNLDDLYGLLGYNDNVTYYRNLIYEYMRGTPFYDDYRIATTSSTKVIEVIRTISQFLGVYGYINADGLLSFKNISPFYRGVYPGSDTFPADDLYPTGENVDITFNRSDYFNAKYEPYDSQKITIVKAYKANGKLAKWPYRDIDNTKILLCGSPQIWVYHGSHVFEDGSLGYTYEKVKDIWYKPSMIEVAGRPWIELGDSYMYTTRKNIIRSYVLKRTLKGIQSLLDTYEAEGEEPKSNSNSTGGTVVNADSMSVGITDTNPGTLTVNGHTVTFKDITISGTTYHLLGYTD